MEQVLLELASLPARYPDVGEDLLITYGPRVIFRLAHDPTRQAESVLSREVHVDWVARPGNAPPQSILRAVGWEGMVDIVRRCPQVALTTNPQTITEQAAIGVMALLVNDLEGATALEVLPIGSGPDYRLWSITSKAFTIEVSGIRKVDSPADARKRLTDKRRQLLVVVQFQTRKSTTDLDERILAPSGRPE